MSDLAHKGAVYWREQLLGEARQDGFIYQKWPNYLFNVKYCYCLDRFLGYTRLWYHLQGRPGKPDTCLGHQGIETKYINNMISTWNYIFTWAHKHTHTYKEYVYIVYKTKGKSLRAVKLDIGHTLLILSSQGQCGVYCTTLVHIPEL